VLAVGDGHGAGALRVDGAEASLVVVVDRSAGAAGLSPRRLRGRLLMALAIAANRCSWPARSVRSIDVR
jgi:hypothetical protein